MTHSDTGSSVMLGSLMLDLEGTVLSDSERELLANPQVGGLILFSRNIGSESEFRQLIRDIRSCKESILIAVDQEGGRVQRLRDGFTRLPPMARFGLLWQQDPERAVALSRECGWLMAAEVLACGLDFSFAPVLDLDTGISEVIGDRAFAAAPEHVAQLARAFMEGMHEAGMATTGKHFPGHGNVAADSHLAIPVDDRSLAEIREQDLPAFTACLDILDAVMPAHVIYPAADSRCAGFSAFWLQTVLRQELGFRGVIFSDDLSMAGAAAAGGIEERVDAALAAGCDMILVCNDREAALQALRRLEAVNAPLRSVLETMRARTHLNKEALTRSARWQQARTLIDTMTA